jgi:hypothetical protein
MDSPTPGKGSAPTGREALRRSRDVWDHQGFITNLVVRWRTAKHLAEFSHAEVLSAALLEGERLLRGKFDPTRGTAATCLSKFLFSRVQYRLLTAAGKKKTPEGWIDSSKLDTPARQREPPPHQATDWEDLLAAIHPDLRPIVRRIGEGEDIDHILAEEESAPLFDSFRDSSREELLSMLRSEVRRIFR